MHAEGKNTSLVINMYVYVYKTKVKETNEYINDYIKACTCPIAKTTKKKTIKRNNYNCPLVLNQMKQNAWTKAHTHTNYKLQLYYSKCSSVDEISARPNYIYRA